MARRPDADDAWGIDWDSADQRWTDDEADASLADQWAVVGEISRERARNEPPIPPPDVVAGAVRSALDVLYRHEAFHHKVESFAIRLEVIEHAKRYEPYSNRVYTPLLNAGSDDLFEEGLACADSIRRLNEAQYRRLTPSFVRTATRGMLEVWIPNLAPGYQRGVALAKEGIYQETRSVLSSQVHEARIDARRGRKAVLLPAGRWDLSPGLLRHIAHAIGLGSVGDLQQTADERRA